MLDVSVQNENKVVDFLAKVLGMMPSEWLSLTTHRLDIYNESMAKKEFLQELEALFLNEKCKAEEIAQLPTAYDYIRLGHPLSSLLEWVIAKDLDLSPENVISFDSNTIALMAIMRTNLLEGKTTRILFEESLPKSFNEDILRRIYGYNFEIEKVEAPNKISVHEGSTILITEQEQLAEFQLTKNIDFYINTKDGIGSVLVVNKHVDSMYVGAIQHVRRRETIAMTPSNTLDVLNSLVDGRDITRSHSQYDANKQKVIDCVKSITGSQSDALVASSGLSMQYGIVMGLVHQSKELYPEKGIRIVVPPNCYGGTNDQARRVVACDPQIEIVDLPVDGQHNMVESIDQVLRQIAAEDAVPLIIAEIPTNPRVEVPEMEALRDVLVAKRHTDNGVLAISPVFILDQTFCPNSYFLREEDVLSEVSTIAYVSGSKFPSGGLCTAGYCVANKKAEHLLKKIELHLRLTQNFATDLQMEILANQLPSMNERIARAYENTRDFVDFVAEKLPTAKINFVSKDLASKGFTPSVFSLDLPTKGDSAEEKEAYKRALNLKLINKMIQTIPSESKFCVSYGQLKGCYWTIPATSTQGTTKEGDKDYIVRVALSANMDLKKHMEVFEQFVSEL